MSRITALALGLLTFAVTSCSHNVEVIDPESGETINIEYGFGDLLTISNTMAESFLSSDRWGGDKPRVVFGGVRNRTQQHLDTENITDTIRAALVQSGKFTVLVGDVGLSEIDKEIGYQQSGAVDMATAAELGKQMGAEYVLYGAFREIRKARDDTTAAWYKFTLNAVNTQTRELIWTQEESIAKKEEKSFMGW